MQKICYHDRCFELYLTQEMINVALDRMAKEINHDYAGDQLLIIPVLNGSFVFAADLVRRLTSNIRISFVRTESYRGTQSGGQVKLLYGLQEDIKNQRVLIVEDIIDTGFTLNKIIEEIKIQHPTDIRVASLLFKPDACEKKIKIDYLGIEIPNVFVIGYGLDYNGLGRNLNNIYKLID